MSEKAIPEPNKRNVPCNNPPPEPAQKKVAAVPPLKITTITIKNVVGRLNWYKNGVASLLPILVNLSRAGCAMQLECHIDTTNPIVKSENYNIVNVWNGDLPPVSQEFYIGKETCVTSGKVNIKSSNATVIYNDVDVTAMLKNYIDTKRNGPQIPSASNFIYRFWAPVVFDVTNLTCTGCTTARVNSSWIPGPREFTIHAHDTSVVRVPDTEKIRDLVVVADGSAKVTFGSIIPSIRNLSVHLSGNATVTGFLVTDKASVMIKDHACLKINAKKNTIVEYGDACVTNNIEIMRLM